jgi:virginiamycin A acetyltransferase
MVRQLKGMMRTVVVYIGIVLLSPLWSLVLLERAFDRKNLFASCSEFLSLFPGRLGIFLRRSFYRMTLDECADDVHVGFQTTLAHPQMVIGRDVYVGNRCSLGMCRLDDGVTIGSNVDILSGRRQHGFDDPTQPVSKQGGSFTAVHIGRNAWIGNSAVIMADLGEGTVIGAGSVVVKAVPTGAVVVGNPARVVRTRAAA